MSTLTTAQAKAHLSISVSTYDSELQGVIDAAEAVITRRCGPLTSTAVTRSVRSSGGAMLLPVIPALSLTSVTPVGGTALTLGDLYLDTEAGLVTYASGSGLAAGYYTVVYSAGRSSVPDDLLLAVKELVRHFWETRRGPTRRPGSTSSDATANSIPGAAYMLPFRVSELIAPHMQPGFA